MLHVLTSVVTGLNVLAAAVSTMDATRGPPVYMTTSKVSTKLSIDSLPTNYDPTEAPKPVEDIMTNLVDAPQGDNLPWWFPESRHLQLRTTQGPDIWAQARPPMRRRRASTRRA